MALNPRNSYLSGMTISASTDRLTLIVGAGLCYLPDATLGTMRLAKDGDTSVVLASPSANTWQHLYAYLMDVNGTVGVEASLTGPSVAYQGTARTKDGDSTRRFLGSVYVGTDSKVIPFLHTSPGMQGNDITYVAPMGQSGMGALALLAPASNPTLFSCAPYVPPGVRKIVVQMENTSSVKLYMGNSEMGSVLSATNFLQSVPANNIDSMEVLLDTSRSFNYLFGGSLLGVTGGLNVRPRSYNFDR